MANNLKDTMRGPDPRPRGNDLKDFLLSDDYRKAKLAREMTHHPFQPPEHLEAAKAVVDMLAQEASGPYGVYRSGEDMIGSLGKGDYGWAALAGLGMLPGIPAITVWHGSPHKFAPTPKNELGEFDASKIGTGEGHAAFGHGAAYLAGAPETAKSYQRGLSDWMPDGVSVEPGSIQDRAAAFVANSIDSGSSNPFGHARRVAHSGDIKDKDHIVKQIEDWWEKGQKFTRGHLYKVDLPDEHVAKMLDWDNPLSEQAPEVQNAFRDLPGAAKLKGEGLYQSLSAQLMPGADRKAGAIAASAKLKERGIPGIRYLDQGSRTNVDVNELHGTIGMLETALRKHPEDTAMAARLADAKQQLAAAQRKQTRNYVVFDPEIARILARE
jgi:hypothetical protein